MGGRPSTCTKPPKPRAKSTGTRFGDKVAATYFGDATPLSYALAERPGRDDVGHFDIDAATGQVKLADDAVLGRNSYSFDVVATDANNDSARIMVTVKVLECEYAWCATVTAEKFSADFRHGRGFRRESSVGALLPSWQFAIDDVIYTI